MLLQFNVSNYMSIKNEVILTLSANADKSHRENLLDFNNDKYLPTIAIYGANAAGKSNLFKALTSAILLVRKSNIMQINNVTGIVPFKFDENTQNEKTKMDFLFVNNGIKYEYGFVGDKFKIYDEYLYEYKSFKPTMIFERINVDEYKFTTAYKKQMSQYVSKNAPNKLFLATATAWNCEHTKNAFLWFAEKIDTYNSLNLNMNSIVQRLNNGNYQADKEFLLNFLRHGDINITDYDFKANKIDESKVILPADLPFNEQVIRNLKENAIEYKFTTKHDIEEENGLIKKYDLDMNEESRGTVMLFAYSQIIKDAFERGRTIVVDEIDNSLHPMLVEYLIKLFNDSTINKNGAQLIFNTHDINLLNLDIFRRDQVYFAEKNNRNGVTDFYSLADYSPRKDENIMKGYMQGRYGAIPDVRGGIEW